MENNPLRAFTVPARIVIVLGIIGTVLGTVAYINWVYEYLPPGTYPVWAFAAPALTVAAVLVGVGLLILKVAGVRIYREDPRDLDEPSR